MPSQNRGEDAASAERQFAEDVGRVFESFGIGRMAGRVLGWLLICEPPRQSNAELGAALGASKGSISTATRMLEAGALIERIAVPGHRGDHFELRPEAFHQAHDQLGTMRVFRELMDRGLAVLGDENSPRAARLRQTRDFYAFLERQFPLLVERFRSSHLADRLGDAPNIEAS